MPDAFRGNEPGQLATRRRVVVRGVTLSLLEAGPPDAPAIVLLHGFPSSSRMYAPLLPWLAHRWHAVAPDYPGFGESDAPDPNAFAYTFDQLAESVSDLLDALGIGRHALFMQDYGGPVGFRMALRDPDRVTAVIVQNANAYTEGLGPKWKGIARFWADRLAHADELERFLSFEATKQRHLGESPHPERYDPAVWEEEFAFLSRPGQRDIQAELLYDYRSNPDRYPLWQAWLRARKPPTLVLWGRFDRSFVVAGAHAYARDVPEAEIHILDAGHFALDEQADTVASLLLAFLDRQLAVAPLIG